MPGSDSTIELTREDFTELPDDYDINDPRPWGSRGGKDDQRGRSPYKEEGGSSRPNQRPDRPGYEGQSSRPSQGQGPRPPLRAERPPGYGGESPRTSQGHSRRRSPLSPLRCRYPGESNDSFNRYVNNRQAKIDQLKEESRRSSKRSDDYSRRRSPSPSHGRSLRSSYGYSRRRSPSPLYERSSGRSDDYSRKRSPSPLYERSSRRSDDYSRRRSPSPSHRRSSRTSQGYSRRRSPLSPLRCRYPGESNDSFNRYVNNRQAKIDQLKEESRRSSRRSDDYPRRRSLSLSSSETGRAYSRRGSPSPSYRRSSRPSHDYSRRRSPSPVSLSPLRQRYPGESDDSFNRYVNRRLAKIYKLRGKRDTGIETFIDPRFKGFMSEKDFYSWRENNERLDKLEKEMQDEARRVIEEEVARERSRRR